MIRVFGVDNNLLLFLPISDCLCDFLVCAAVFTGSIMGYRLAVATLLRHEVALILCVVSCTYLACWVSLSAEFGNMTILKAIVALYHST